jgi:maltose O-acetyltransferase
MTTNTPPSVIAKVHQLLTERGYANEKLRIVEAAERAVANLRARAVLRGCEVGPKVCVHGPVRIVRKGRIVLGPRSFTCSGPLPVELVCHEGGELVIGEFVGINYGTSIECAKSIRIGDRSMIASFVRISDRTRNGAAPVRIGSEVWIAHGAIIEPGVTIGDGAVIAAGAVVTTDVPARTMAVGNPARSMPFDMARGTR